MALAPCSEHLSSGAAGVGKIAVRPGSSVYHVPGVGLPSGKLRAGKRCAETPPLQTREPSANFSSTKGEL